MSVSLSRVASAAVACLAVTAVAACGSSAGGASPSGSPSGAGASTTSPLLVQVVASTNVWGQIAQEVGGDHVKVTSFITDPSQDPHSYEANTQNQLSIKRAALVIENGGGYDDFIDTMLKAADNPGVKVLNAVHISGKTAPAGGDLNEHVWYDLPTVGKVADEVAATLGALDPANASEFTKNAGTFTASVTPVQTAVAAIKAAHAGAGVAVTEPAPGYLLDEAGLQNKTPEEFSKAIQNGTDVAPAVLQQTLQLISGKQVKALVYNEQTSGPTTEAVKKAAADAGIAVVPVTETLPHGKTYVQWMSSQVTALRAALAGS